MLINAENYPLMAAAGYLFDKGSVGAPGTNKRITDEALIDKIEGRLNNVQYMAHAMDIFDTASSNVPPNRQGGLQFAHLMRQEDDLVWHGYIYAALRRFQRQNKNDALRAGIAMLFAVENGIVAGRDAVLALAPDFIQMHDLRNDDGGKALERQRQLTETTA